MLFTNNKNIFKYQIELLFKLFLGTKKREVNLVRDSYLTVFFIREYLKTCEFVEKFSISDFSLHS
jgi:hypothetical protein